MHAGDTDNVLLLEYVASVLNLINENIMPSSRQINFAMTIVWMLVMATSFNAQRDMLHAFSTIFETGYAIL